MKRELCRKIKFCFLLSNEFAHIAAALGLPSLAFIRDFSWYASLPLLPIPSLLLFAAFFRFKGAMVMMRIFALSKAAVLTGCIVYIVDLWPFSFSDAIVAFVLSAADLLAIIFAACMIFGRRRFAANDGASRTEN